MPAAENRSALADLLKSPGARPESSLSPEQHRLWLLRKLNPEVPTHTVVACGVRGSLDIRLLEASVNNVIMRHEALRMSFIELAGRPARVLTASARLQLRLASVTDAPDGGFDSPELRELAVRESNEPFDLRSAPLVRVLLIRTSLDDHVVLVTMHQLVGDRESAEWFLDESLRAYDATAAGEIPHLKDPPAQLAGLISEQREWLSTDTCAQQISYWRGALAGICALDVPVDLPRQATRTHRGASRVRDLDPSLAHELGQFCSTEGVSFPDLVQASFHTLLAWYSGQDDIAVGISARGSGNEGFEGVVGPLANQVVVRTKTSMNTTFRELLHLVRDSRKSALANSQVPFATLVSELDPPRDLGRTPFFQARFAVEEHREWPLLKTIRVEPLAVSPGIALYDLTLSLRFGDSVRLSMEYNVDLFRSSTIDRMLTNLCEVLVHIGPEGRKLSELMIPADDERRELLEVRNAMAASGECIQDWIAAQAAATPDAIAVVAGESRLSYGELDARARKLCAGLRSAGVGHEDRVAVCMEHSSDAVVALLGVLFSGAAYVPLDPSVPPDRLAFVLEDSGSRLVCTQSALRSRFADSNLPVVAVDVDFHDRPVDSGAPARSSPQQLAYVIYTSGSTGRPKGVGVTHQNVANNLAWRQRTWRLTAADRVLQSYSFAFDPSVWATFWPLTAGASVVLPAEHSYFDARKMIREIADRYVTVYGAAPSLHSTLVEDRRFRDCSALRLILSGGEALESDLVRRIRGQVSAEVCNMYGPTEATIDCTWHPVPASDQRAPAPIGEAIANTAIYITDSRLGLAPTGVTGEICIGGISVARGYIGNPRLTAERFVPDPFAPVPGSRMYMSGDLGRIRADKQIDFLGRKDDQVKIRGFRIEPGEIERSLAAHPSVHQAAVVVRPSSGAVVRLIAFLESEHTPDDALESIEASLRDRLPSYMIPDIFVFTKQLPRTATGKVDRTALRSPDEDLAVRAEGFVPPRSTLEMEVSRIVASVLGLPEVGIADDLFTLGCDSLLLSRLGSRLSKAYDIDIAVHQLFQEPTVAGIAELLGRYGKDGRDSVTQPWTLSQLESEAALDPSIDAEGLPPADFIQPRNILLTGATGYLGSFLLERLIADTPATIICLVRARNSDDGMARIENALRGYGIWKDHYRSRIRPAVGDLARPLLGLSAETFDELAETADTIYHCGALVNFVFPYSAVRAANVQGTHEVIRLAARTKVKPIHFTSTVDVLLAAGMRRPFLEDDTVLTQPIRVPDGYGRSKWVGEKMLTEARKRGIPVCVYRPGLVMGHTTSGATQTTDYLIVMLKGYIELGILPRPRIAVDFITVDHVAEVISHLSRREDSLDKYFHIWNPRSVRLGQIYEWIVSYGYGLEVKPDRVFQDTVLAVDETSALFPFLPLFRTINVDEPMSSPNYDPEAVLRVDVAKECANTIHGIEASSITCPPLTEDLAHLTFSYLSRLGFLPDPAVRAEIGVN